MFFAELQLNELALQFRPRDRVLRDHAAIVFDFHFKIVVREHLIPEIENLRERAGIKSMVHVVRDVGLQQASVGRVMQRAAAIDEPLRDMPDFGDVKMRWDLVAIRQSKARERRGTGTKERLEFA